MLLCSLQYFAAAEMTKWKATVYYCSFGQTMVYTAAFSVHTAADILVFRQHKWIEATPF